jgi:hypothetical protein
MPWTYRPLEGGKWTECSYLDVATEMREFGLKPRQFIEECRLLKVTPGRIFKGPRHEFQYQRSRLWREDV